jgi:hypothetical protein
MARPERAPDQIAEADHDRHHVVHFVRHAAGELAHRLQPVRLPRLVLGHDAVVDVGRAAEPHRRVTLVVAVGTRGREHPPIASFAGSDPMLDLEPVRPGADGRRPRGDGRGAVVRMQRGLPSIALDLLGAKRRDLGPPRVAVGHAPRRIGRPDELGNSIG